MTQTTTPTATAAAEGTATDGRKVLTQEQVNGFWKNGFLRFGKILDDELLETMRREYDREFELVSTGRSDRSMFRNLSGASTDDLDTINRSEKKMLQIMQMCERNLHFRKLVYNDAILDVIEDLMGPNIQLFHDQALYKPAHHGGPVHWHQDNAYWRCSPATLISCWLTLDDVDEQNGAMQLIPGTHTSLLDHAKAKQSDLLLDITEQIDASKAVVVDLPAGGAMFHHCQTFHYTAPNTTDRQRRAFAIHFMQPGTRSLRQQGYLGVSWGNPMLRMGLGNSGSGYFKK
ncbi:MAG TPA: phytanoyl-CoA dioxygenase family protein [Spirochaetia bacterium]|nr:phytanoyl-CoA dioxygenase family protein [Spirochaetia bacterium]